MDILETIKESLIFKWRTFIKCIQ